MKILRLLASVNPATGGPIEAVRQVSRVHVAQGHTVELASLDDPAKPWVAECEFPLHAFGPVSGKFGFTPRLEPWLREHHAEYDAIFIEGLWQYHSFGSWRALHDTGRAYHVFPHGMLDGYFKRRYPLKHLKKLVYWLGAERKVLRDARAVLFTCEEERQCAANTFRPYRCAQRVVTLGTAEPPGDPEAVRAAFFTKFPQLRDQRLLLFLGRIHEKKGCDLLVEAFAAEARETPDLHLVLAGPDETGWQASLAATAAERGIADRIVWAGMLGGDHKWGAFRAAEAFILPSHQENFGVAVAEALACGTPVLISDKVNIWREIVAARGGFAETDTLDGTRRLLQRWIALSPDERTTARQTARRCFEDHFEVQRAAQMQLDLLRVTDSAITDSRRLPN